MWFEFFDDIFLLTLISCLYSDIDPSFNNHPQSGTYSANYRDTLVKYIATDQQQNVQQVECYSVNRLWERMLLYLQCCTLVQLS